MSAFFLKILNMSIAGGIVILLVLLARLVFKRAPKWTRLVLWGMVGIRLALPFFPETSFSLMPSTEAIAPVTALAETPAPIVTQAPAFTQTPTVTGRPNVTHAPTATQFPRTTEKPASTVAPVTGNTEETEPAPKSFDWLSALAWVWLSGAAVMLAYAVISYAALKRRLSTAVRLEENVFEADAVKTPFLLGIFAPKIYLPFGMDARSRELVLMHERAHMRGLDNVIKPLGWALLAVHWFNPLVWLAFLLFSKDLELACDERVIRGLGADERADYSQTLLNLSVKGRRISACPLAFGESNVKERVKNVFSYKKPALWIIIAALLVTAFITVCFLTSPKKNGAHRLISMTEAAALADENGWVVVPDDFSYSILKGAERWDIFIEKVNMKEPAEVVLVMENADPIEGKYKDIEDKLGVYPAMFKRIAFDGEKYTLGISSVYPVDFEKHGEFSYLGYAFYPGGDCWLYYLADEPLVDVSSDESFTLYEGNAYPLFKLSNNRVSRDGDPYAKAAEQGWAAVDMDHRFTCGRDAWESFYNNYLNGVPGEVTVVRTVPAENVSFETGIKEPGAYLIVISRVRYDGEKLFVRESTGVDEFGAETEYNYLEVTTTETEDGVKLVSCYLTRIRVGGLWTEVHQSTISDDDIYLLLTLRADEADMSGRYTSFGYHRDESSMVADWPVDLDGDGTDEVFHADLGLIVDDSFSVAWVTDASGKLLGNMMLCGSGHTALNTFAVVESPEYGRCIMQILPEWGGQTYGYMLRKVVDGEFKTVFYNLFWQFGDEEPLDWNKAEAQAYENEVNALLESGYILITTDRSGVMRGELRERGTSGNVQMIDIDRPVEFDQNNTLAVVCTAGSTGDGIERMRSSSGAESICFTDYFLTYVFKCVPYTGEQDIDAELRERFEAEAWELAEEISELHGVELARDTCLVQPYSHTQDYTVQFSDAGYTLVLEVWMLYDEDRGDWACSMETCHLFVSVPEGIDGQKLVNDMNALSPEDGDITVDTVSGGPASFDTAARSVAELAAEAYSYKCEADNYFKCYEAHVIEVVPSEWGEGSYDVRLVIRPVNEWFSGNFAGSMGPMYGGSVNPEWRGYYTVWVHFTLTLLDDQSFTYRFGY